MPNYVKQIIKFEKIEDLELVVNKYCINKNNDENEIDFGESEINFDFNKIIEMPKELDVENNSNGKMGFNYLINPITFIINNKKTQAFKDLIKKISLKPLRELENYEIQNILEENKSKVKELNYMDIDLGEQYKYNLETFGATDWYDWRIKNWGTKWNSCETNINKEELYISFETAWDIAEPIICKIVLNNDLKIELYFADEGCGFCGKSTIFLNENKLIETLNDNINENFEQDFVNYTFSEDLNSLNNLIENQNNEHNNLS